jgi:hypothetical protein
MLAQQGKGNNGFAAGGEFFEQLLFEFMWNGHFAGRDLFGGCACET